MRRRRLAALAGLLPGLAVFALIGCQALNPTPPVEAYANKLTDEVVIPLARSAAAEGFRQILIQAGAQAINPTYVVRFKGHLVQGIEGEATLGVEGISGQLQVSGGSPASSRPSAVSTQPAGQAPSNQP